MTMTIGKLSIICSAAVILCAGCSSVSAIRLPGRISDERTLLPNGWTLSPAGKSIPLGDLPLGIDIARTRGVAAVINSGYSDHSISLVDLRTQSIRQTVPVKLSWNGIEFSSDESELYISSGNDNGVLRYRFDADTLVFINRIELGKPYPADTVSPSGIAVAPNGRTLYVASKGSNALYRVNLMRDSVEQVLPLSHPAYTCRIDEPRHVIYVTLWGGASVAVIDERTFTLITTIPVGDHPSEMLLSDDGTRLYVVNSNHNTVSVIDCLSRSVIRTFSVSLSASNPNGSTPNSLALSHDQKTLYVANADNNALAVLDADSGAVRGFIPTGWYPTLVRAYGTTLLVANGKGESSKSNADKSYIGNILTGSLSFIPVPSGEEEQNIYTARVFENSPILHPSDWDDDSPIPNSRDKRSPITHVFYIIKENRTYDQVFGDKPEGNGDSSLTMFGREVTPNHHALTDEFVLLDNFYADAEVSADGHNWSMAAYATDYVEKTWPTFYGGGGGAYDFENEGIMSPSVGYIWDNCLRHNVTIRNYGEFLSEEESANRGRYIPNVAGLMNYSSAEFPGWDLNYPDRKRVSVWMKEFDRYERGDSLPQFSIIRLPNDHTAGTKKGGLSPRAMVADNDLALGMVVERISKSRYWKSSAIFVIEDDAQSGADHVDAHRTVALVVSPYTKRRYVDHTMYSTSSMLRTIELIFGLPPMSQFDAASTPMFFSFTSVPDTASYRLRPNLIDVNEHNALGAYGQDRMETMNLDREDAVPELEFNQIIWKSIMGVNSEMPMPVRSIYREQ
ncbi:MAG TPA: bifunctional YncE family protein/alkaline phosphatase family protein [Bacteroidota bacterium]|nr:bifunctional YncE family protein/alkaline phosphatase family protein [Bacteroidota bacterium]